MVWCSPWAPPRLNQEAAGEEGITRPGIGAAGAYGGPRAMPDTRSGQGSTPWGPEANVPGHLIQRHMRHKRFSG